MDDSFGEIGFFTSLSRQVSVKARDFTEVLTINRHDFLQLASNISHESIDMFQKIHSEI